MMYSNSYQLIKKYHFYQYFRRYILIILVFVFFETLKKSYFLHFDRWLLCMQEFYIDRYIGEDNAEVIYWCHV
jgi:hypothetical protein